MRHIYAPNTRTVCYGMRLAVSLSIAQRALAAQMELHRLVEQQGGHSLRSLHGEQYSPGPPWHAHLILRRAPGRVRTRDPVTQDLARTCALSAAGDAAKVKALVNMVMNANTAALAETSD